MNRWIRTLRSVESAVPAISTAAGVASRHASSARDAGDRARAQGDWGEAERQYRRHVDTHPADGAIWVQLGHARKESGDLAGAEAAYRRAQALRPDDGDVPLQIGHLMKLQGRPRDAAAAYEAALALAPSSDAYDELVRMGRHASAARLAEGAAGAPTLYLQISDLLNFLRAHRTPSGIQRVQLGILESGLADGERMGGMAVAFVVGRPHDTRIWKASRRSLVALVDELRRAVVDPDRLRSAAEDAIATASLVHPRRDDVFVVLGAFWGLPDNVAMLNALRRQGTSIGVYIYDVIPITHPEYCHYHLVVDFTSDFCETFQLIDFALAISDFTAAQVRAFVERHGLAERPLAVVPLAHRLTGGSEDEPEPEGEAAEWTGDIAHLRGREFVLCVCTIEPRKNHRYLYDVWKALAEEGLAVPDLVFVGRRGWNVDDLFVQMENSDWLGGRISVVHDLSDRQLALLYGACLFTAFPSLIEGWGLPVGESLSHGRLCVSSMASSMPEVGGDLVAYIDPLNLRDGIATVRDLLLDRTRIHEWERRIAAGFTPRAWSDVARDFFAAVERLRTEPSVAPGERVARLRPGAFLHFGRFARDGRLRPIAEYVALERLALGDSFYPPEATGAWMKGRAGTVRFHTGLPAGTDIVCLVVVKGAPNLEGGRLLLSGSIVPSPPRPLAANRTETIRLKGSVEAGGQVSVTFKFDGSCPAHPPDPREFCLALVGLGFAEVGDAVGRAELLEGLLFDHADLRCC